MKTVIRNTVLFVGIVCSCNTATHKGKIIHAANSFSMKMEAVLGVVSEVTNKYVLDSSLVSYRLVYSAKDTAFRNMIHDKRLKSAFEEFDIEEVSLEKNKECIGPNSFQKIVFYLKDGKTSYNYYQCSHHFGYVDEFENDLVYLKKISQDFELVYEK